MIHHQNSDICFLCLPDILAKQIHIYYFLFYSSTTYISPMELWSITMTLSFWKSFFWKFRIRTWCSIPTLLFKCTWSTTKTSLYFFDGDLACVWLATWRQKNLIQGHVRGIRAASCWISWQAGKTMERFISYKIVHCNLSNCPRK